MMCALEKKHACETCKQRFSRSFNLRRHMITVHKTVASEEEQTEAANNKHQCPLCYKGFSHKWCLTRHIAICKGEKKLFECSNCLNTFKYERSLCRHSEKCSVKKETAIITNNTIETQNNITTQNNIETQNQNNNIIIVYNTSGNTPFTTEHLTAEDLKKILQLASPHIDSRAIAEYSKQIFSNKENRCIKKTNIKAGHSRVHTGDNKWDNELDSSLYPKLASDMATNMFDFLNSKRDKMLKNVFEGLTNFADYMADNGYINTEDAERRKVIEKEYKVFVKRLRLIVYGLTTDKSSSKVI
jgi:hypothetical protein